MDRPSIPPRPLFGVLLALALATGCTPDAPPPAPENIYGQDSVSLRPEISAAFKAMGDGDREGAVQVLYAVVDSAQGDVLAKQRFVALNLLSKAYQDQGRYDSALACGERALAIVTRFGDQKGMATAEQNMGVVCELQGDYEAALAHALRSLVLKEATNDKRGIANILNNLSALHYRQNNLAEAERLMKRAMALKLELGDSDGYALAQSSLGLLRMEAGDLDSAVHLFRASLIPQAEDPERSGKYSNLALAFAKQGRLDSALILNTLALEEARAWEDPGLEIKALYGSAEVLMDLGRYREAAPLLDSCMAIARRIDAAEEVKETYVSLSRLAAGLGDHATALEHFKRYHILSDSLMNTDKDAAMQDLRMKYDTAKKDRENDELRAAHEVTALVAARNRWIAVGAVLLALGIGVVAWLLVQRARQRAAQQVADLEQQALRLQMDPHFLFNALNTIPGLYSSGDMVRANDHVGHLSKFLRLVLETSRRSSIPLQQELELIENYLHICADRRPDAFTWDIHVAPEIHPDRLAIPPMLLQPLVENALAHGLGGVESGGHVDVRVEQEDDQVRITVRDNGVGRNVAAQRRSQRPGVSMGMDLVRKRLAIHGRSVRRRAALQVIDDTHADGSTQGTTVVVRMGIHDIRGHA